MSIRKPAFRCKIIGFRTFPSSRTASRRKFTQNGTFGAFRRQMGAIFVPILSPNMSGDFLAIRSLIPNAQDTLADQPWIMPHGASWMIMHHWWSWIMHQWWSWIIVHHQWFCIIMHHGSWSIMDHDASCMTIHHGQPWVLLWWPGGCSGNNDKRETPKWLTRNYKILPVSRFS